MNFCEQQAEKMKVELANKYPTGFQSKEYNLRIDPYAERAAKEEYESHFRDLDTLTQWVENNNMVESILQSTSDSILKQRCNANNEYLNTFWENMRNSTN